MDKKIENICAIVVTFYPDLEVLKQQLYVLARQVDHIVVVDNGSSIDLGQWLGEQCLTDVITLLSLDHNYGIAKAHNLGIAHARDCGATYVLLMDQDSIPADDMVGQLVRVALDNKNVAAVGPRYFDNRQCNPPPFIAVKGFKLERYLCNGNQRSVTTDYLISSGCLIPMATLNVVGGMREDFFIDYVDIEWGLRAKACGFQSFGACGAYMHHSLGDTPQRFFGKNIPVHSPLRHYYHVRNAILLYKEDWVPWNWKVVDGWRLFLKFVYYSLMTKPRFRHFLYMSKGIVDGVLGRSGAM